MKINYNGLECEIDMEEALSQGIAKPIHKEIVDFAVGDVFGLPKGFSANHSPVVVLQKQYESYHNRHITAEYVFGGNYGMDLYSVTPMKRDALLKYLNANKLVKLGNINDVVKKYIDGVAS